MAVTPVGSAETAAPPTIELAPSSVDFWHRSAPRTVRRPYRREKPADGWKAWARHLRRRCKPADLRKLLRGGGDPLAWELPETFLAAQVVERIESELKRAAKDATAGSALADRLVTATAAPLGGRTAPESGEVLALECLAWARALPRGATVLPADAFWGLLAALATAGQQAGRFDLERQPLGHQWLAGELPLTLAYLFPEIKPCRNLARPGRRAVSAALAELLDGKGLPHARYLDLLRPLLACWTRCRAMDAGLKGGCFTAAGEVQYEWLVRHALRLARCDASHVFSNGLAEPSSGKLLRAALRLGGDKDDRRIARLALPPAVGGGNGKPARARSLPKSAMHSAWAATAVLRPDWSRTGPRLAVTYHDRTTRLEFAAGKDLLFSGTWELDVRIDGRPALPGSDWEEICWLSDRDVDYLELEIDLEAGVRVQRHFLLARRDRFLLLADTVLGERSARLDYRGALPLAAGARFRGAEEAREGYLLGRKRRAVVMPLSLPEWRAEIGGGELLHVGDALELSQSAEGSGLCAPLWFDLDRRRMQKRLTWRRLTVGEWLRAVPPEVAVGYRVAVGGRQWIVYRTLGPVGNRTLLGHNLSTQMLVGRFDRSGEVESLLEIE